MIRYSTSFRCRPIEETLKIARTYAKQHGIVRVTDTTWLDKLGIPVYASIRPEAMPGGLCVNSGKGFTKSEAMVGAYMEAIEFANCEPGAVPMNIQSLLPESVYLGAGHEEALLNFCPIIGKEIDLDIPFQCVESTEINTSSKYMVPAELVFFPFPNKPGFQKAYSSSTNGLSSGNSRTETIIHGLLEVIERHVLSFHMVEDHSDAVLNETLPDHLNPVLKQLEEQRLELVVRFANNPLGIPVFIAYVIDTDFRHPMFINAGYGCHTFKDIALSRAVAEAIQSRLVLIHGARDDIPHSHEIYEGLSSQELLLNFDSISRSLKDSNRPVSFEDIHEYKWDFTSLEDYLDQLLELLHIHHFEHVLTVPFTQAESSIQVIKTIVPKMEFYSRKSQRIGPLLRDYAQSVAS